MSLDYPLYEEMVRRGSRGRWFWRIGSWLNYAGLAGIILVLILWPMVFFFRIGDAGLVYAVALLFMAGLYVVGNFLKKVSYRIALNEGIDITKYIEDAGDR